MKLNQCPLRVRGEITDVDVEPRFDLRLQELGIRPGAQFVAINKAAFGGVVLNIGGTRVAVDRASSRKIDTRLVDATPRTAK